MTTHLRRLDLMYKYDIIILTSRLLFEILEYKTLTEILDEPTIYTIAKLHREMKRNAQKIPTILGGGQNGYLGLVTRQSQELENLSDLKIQENLFLH